MYAGMGLMLAVELNSADLAKQVVAKHAGAAHLDQSHQRDGAAVFFRPTLWAASMWRWR